HRIAVEHPQQRSFMACNTLTLRKETFFCWLERQKEHSFCNQTLSVHAGKLVGHIFTARLFMQLLMTVVPEIVEWGLQRRADWAQYFVPLMISERVGPIHQKPQLNFPARVDSR